MPESRWLMVLIPLAYLAGSIPFGLVVGRWRGVDPRTAGSGNIGATNVGRLLGRRYFVLVFTLDLLKGMGPMLAASAIVHAIPAASRDVGLHLLWLLVGVAAVLGHMFSAFLKFAGGKGVATSLGVALGLVPYFTLPGFGSIAVFVAVFSATRYVSLGSMAGACAFPVAYLAIGAAWGWDLTGNLLPLTIFAVLIAGMIVYKHRGNIARLRAGTESRVART